MNMQGETHDIADEPMPKAHRIATTLIDLADGVRLPMVWLRPRRLSLDTLCEDDLDFLYDPDGLFDILNTLFGLCRQEGLSLRLIQSDGFKTRMEILVTPGKVLQLEMWSHAEFRNADSHGHMSRCAIPFSAYRGLPEEQKNSALGAIFLLHLHHKEKALHSPGVRERLAYFVELKGMAPVLQSCMREMLVGHVTVEHGRVCAHHWVANAGLNVTGPYSFQFLKLKRFISGIRVPACNTIAVVGPDGSGKTTLMEACRSTLAPAKFKFVRFKRYFRRVLIHVVRREPRNVRDEKMLWLILPVAWVHFMLVRLSTGWMRPALMDRYFYDYLAKDVRSTSRPLQRITAYGALTCLVPRPAKLVVACCATQVILARKDEMQAASIDALYALYLDQACQSRVPEVLFCSTQQTIEQAATQMCDFILDRQ